MSDLITCVGVPDLLTTTTTMTNTTIEIRAHAFGWIQRVHLFPTMTLIVKLLGPYRNPSSQGGNNTRAFLLPVFVAVVPHQWALSLSLFQEEEQQPQYHPLVVGGHPCSPWNQRSFFFYWKSLACEEEEQRPPPTKTTRDSAQKQQQGSPTSNNPYIPARRLGEKDNTPKYSTTDQDKEMELGQLHN